MINHFHCCFTCHVCVCVYWKKIKPRSMITVATCDHDMFVSNTHFRIEFPLKVDIQSVSNVQWDDRSIKHYRRSFDRSMSTKKKNLQTSFAYVSTYACVCANCYFVCVFCSSVRERGLSDGEIQFFSFASFFFIYYTFSKCMSGVSCFFYDPNCRSHKQAEGSIKKSIFLCIVSFRR